MIRMKAILCTNGNGDTIRFETRSGTLSIIQYMGVQLADHSFHSTLLVSGAVKSPIRE